MSRRTRAASRLLLALALVGVRVAGAQAQPPAAPSCAGATKPVVAFFYGSKGGFDPASVRPTGGQGPQSHVPLGHLELAWLSVRDFQAVVGQRTLIDQLGGDSSEIAANIGSEFVFTLVFERRARPMQPVERLMIGRLVNQKTAQVVRAFERRLDPVNDSVMLDQVTSEAERVASDLACDVFGVRLRPVRPLVTLFLLAEDNTPATEVAPGATVTAWVRLTDAADELPQPGHELVIEHAMPNGTLSRVTTSPTDFFGNASTILSVGNTVDLGIVQAFFRRDDGLKAESAAAAYRVVNPTGALAVSSPRAALRVGQTETVTALLRRNGVPAAGEPVAFRTDGWGRDAAGRDHGMEPDEPPRNIRRPPSTPSWTSGPRRRRSRHRRRRQPA